MTAENGEEKESNKESLQYTPDRIRQIIQENEKLRQELNQQKDFLKQLTDESESSQNPLKDN